MSNFNLDNYETVKARKKRFYADYPDGRIIVDLITLEKDESAFRVSVFKTIDEQRQNLPIATGYGHETRGIGGMANKFAHVYNCEESAIGRALDNAGYATNEKCSREEMMRVAQKEKEFEEAKELLRSALRGLDEPTTKTFLKAIGASSLKDLAQFDYHKINKCLEVLSGITNAGGTGDAKSLPEPSSV